MPEIYEGIIAIFGLLLAILYRKLQVQLASSQKEVDAIAGRTEEELFSEGVKNIRLNIREFNPIAKQIGRVSKETKIDRILILVGVNGNSKPERATVLWDANDEEVWPYDDVALDTDYQERFEHITKHPYLQFRTNDPTTQNTNIGTWYKIEGVKSSIWIAIAKKSSINTQQTSYIYMSCATHGDEDMGHEEVRAGQNIATLMRHVVSTHGYRPI